MIIDFGNSCYIDELNDLTAQNDDLNWGKKFNTLKELLQHEENEICV